MCDARCTMHEMDYFTGSNELWHRYMRLNLDYLTASDAVLLLAVTWFVVVYLFHVYLFLYI